MSARPKSNLNFPGNDWGIRVHQIGASPIAAQPKYKDENLWSPQAFDVYWRIAARQILALQNALK
ncbi:MAG: hypothetical protein IT210_22875 [Armatimonadetes bacterium]|nr:hypothetical protein [Armatimonadota bacterium]